MKEVLICSIKKMKFTKMSSKDSIAKEKTWYMYVVECADGTLYTGITTDISRRLNEHNYGSRGAKYTRSRRPVKLRLTHEYKGRSPALKAEYKFKKLTRKQKKEIINGRD